MCGFADFRKDFSGVFRIFGKVYENFWNDTPLGLYIAINFSKNTTLYLRNDNTRRFEHYSSSGVKVSQSIVHAKKDLSRSHFLSSVD